MKIFIFSLALLFALNFGIEAQSIPSTINGIVYEQTENDTLIALVGANIYWLGTNKGTVSNADGTFSIAQQNNAKQLIISFAGLRADTISIEEKDFITAKLHNDLSIQQVKVIKRWKTTSFSLLDPIKVETIGENELLKAACCNLSESFETNASVDVSFSDAITGTKQIQLLGLAGAYTQITRENMPDIRGLSAIYGMEYIPGTWIESIQLNKGAGSVVNGYESIAGQINVELRKPQSADRIYLNVYGNEDSRVEANLNLKHKLNDKLSTGLLLHARTQPTQMDRNDDGFMDKPIGDQYIILNRWKFTPKNNWQSQLGIKATYNNNIGGQIGYATQNAEQLWGMEMETKRLESWLKAGKVFDKNPTQSIGMQFSGVTHDQESFFGQKNYTATQQSGYANFIFQSKSNVYHAYKIGASFQYDNFDEELDSINFVRDEIVPGMFGEYNFSPNDKFDLVAGLRADFHNNFGLFFTPRLHLRYAPAERSIVRFSLGKGYRTASVIAENNSVLASSRVLIIESKDKDTPYGLEQEEAWNYGANFTQKFRLDYRDGVITFDLYHTRFKQQIVMDLDESPQTILFYNLNGESYSTSFQVQADYELFRRFDARVAYRWHEVQTQYKSGIKDKPLAAPHRAFVNLAYENKKYWKFDYTVQWTGKKRIPSTSSNPIEYQLEDFSPSYFLMNAQISKQWAEKFEVYVGIENILDFTQEDPILAAENPFGPHFDASLTWGPIFGRMLYGGIRLRIK